MKLSILICTILDRDTSFRKLLSVLTSQQTDEVEILSECDTGQMSTGAKRNLLLQRATGDYICFVDDDDMVSDDYVSLILKELESEPDCVGITVAKTKDGMPFRRLVKSLECLKTQWIWNYNQLNNTQYMIPDHLTPVRREIALKVGFKDISKGEDTVYSIGILPYLHIEKVITKPIYFYDLQIVEKRYEKINQNPLVTAITITRDRVDFVKQSIQYFLSQTHTNKEMVIVCHGTDETKRELRKTALKYENIKFMELPTHGVTKGGMINFALEVAKGEYCIQWDDDDYHAPKRIETQLLPIIRNFADVTTLATFKMDNGELVKSVMWCDGLDGTMLWKNTNVRSPLVSKGHDTLFMDVLKSKYRTLKIYDDYKLYTYFIHDKQVVSKQKLFESVTSFQTVRK